MITITAPQQTTRRLAARLSVTFSVTFLLALAALHVLRTDLDPSWRVISEYEIGRYGWLMQSAFLALSISTVAAGVARRAVGLGRGGRAGLILLGVSALGMLLGGVAISDPITATSEQVTTHGSLHALAALLGIPTFPVAAGLVTRGILRGGGWAGSLRALRFAAVGTWVGLGQMVLAMVVLLPANDGVFGPDVQIGWSNRLLILTYVAWLLVLTAPLASSRR